MVNESNDKLRIEDICIDADIKSNIGQVVKIQYVDALNQMNITEGEIISYNGLNNLLVRSLEENQINNVPLIGLDSAVREVVLKGSGKSIYFNDRIEPFYNPYNSSFKLGKEVVNLIDVDMMIRYNEFLKERLLCDHKDR